MGGGIWLPFLYIIIANKLKIYLKSQTNWENLGELKKKKNV